MDDEEEVDTAVNRRYSNLQTKKTTRYEPTFQGKRYEDDAGSMSINYEDALGSTRTEEDTIEQVLVVTIFLESNGSFLF